MKAPCSALPVQSPEEPGWSSRQLPFIQASSGRPVSSFSTPRSLPTQDPTGTHDFP